MGLAVVTIKSKAEPSPQRRQASIGHHKPVGARTYLSPPEVFEHLTDTGAEKAQITWIREIALGILAGCYIGFGFSMCMIVGGQLKSIKYNEPGLFNLVLGAIGFPFGLTLVVLGGGNLFTSNTEYMMTACFEGKAKWRHLLRVWIVSYIANFVGALIQAQLMTWGEVYKGREEFTLMLALKKTSYPFSVTVVKGLLCNWLVNMAVWQANAAQDVVGKFIGIWLPISAFVALGLEHCVANMFMIPFSMMIWDPKFAGQYDKVSMGRFLGRNLLPATIGNILGACIFVGGFYTLAYGSWAEKFEERVKQWLRVKAQNFFRGQNTFHVQPSPAATPKYADLGVSSPHSGEPVRYFGP